MKTTTLEKLNNYEEGHCDRNDNGDLIIKKYLLEDTYSSFIPYYTSDSMEELNELIDERFTFNDEENNLFYEDNVIDLPMYLTQSLRTKLDRLGSFHLYKWDWKSRTYIEDLNLGTRTYPK
jgi:hypothetical protein|tara:strand:- start:204 stop:566 length:363 start_codon:yes stop_codon:yes gene_type:complete